MVYIHCSIRNQTRNSAHFRFVLNLFGATGSKVDLNRFHMSIAKSNGSEVIVSRLMKKKSTHLARAYSPSSRPIPDLSQHEHDISV
jgi:hypothetical protein